MPTSGSTGEILHVDLSSGIPSPETPTNEFVRKIIGGNGYAAKLIFDHVPADVDPLGGKNAVAIAVGPLTDTPLWGTSRAHMAVISPQAGLFCDSNFGGDFAVAQRRTGFDAILIQGKSSRALYLFITEGKVEFRDASHGWGMTTEETIAILQGECGKGSVCMAIGPAGERKIPFANVVSGGRRFGTAGRGRQGAVFGSKNLKAIVVMGGLETIIADPEGLGDFLKRKFPELKKNKGILTKYGTGYLPGFMNAKGILGTRNNARETFDAWWQISADFFLLQYGQRSAACRGWDKNGVPSHQKLNKLGLLQ
jgi:aldehyde:ferredoxin oxidoreductase